MTATEEVAETLKGFGAGLSLLGEPGNSEVALSVSEVSSAADWDVVIDQIVEICQLENGWDGEGAPAPSKPLLASTMKLAKLLRGIDCPAPRRAVPSFDGTMILEWQDLGFLAELEVVSPGQAEGTIHREGHSTQRMLLTW